MFLGLFADLAGPNDYAFEPVKTEVIRGDDVVLAVRLVHKRPRKAIPNAMIVVIRIDMAPDGMKEKLRRSSLRRARSRMMGSGMMWAMGLVWLLVVLFLVLGIAAFIKIPLLHQIRW